MNHWQIKWKIKWTNNNIFFLYCKRILEPNPHFCLAKPRGYTENLLETRTLHCSAMKQTHNFGAVVRIQTSALWIESSIRGAENPDVCRSICLPLVNYTWLNSPSLKFPSLSFPPPSKFLTFLSCLWHSWPNWWSSLKVYWSDLLESPPSIGNLLFCHFLQLVPLSV